MTIRTAFAAPVLVLALLGLLPSPVAAQEARSFEQLQLLLKPGDKIFITDAMGNVTKGKVAGLSKSALSLTTKGSTKDWAQSDVLKIRQWRQDSLKNGALIGTGVGFSIGLATVIAFCGEWTDCGGDAVAAVAIYTGLGTGIGVGIDALIPAKQTIYVGGAQTSASRLKVRPLVGKSRKGVAVALSF